MPEKKPLYGVYIRRSPKLFRDDAGNKFWKIRYGLEAGAYDAKEIRAGVQFATTPAIAGAVESYLNYKPFHNPKSAHFGRANGGRAFLGSMEFLADSKEKITVMNHSPTFSILPSFDKRFSAASMSHIVDQKILKDLERKFPGHKIIEEFYSHPTRLKRVRWQGRNPGEAMPVQWARQLLRGKIIFTERNRDGQAGKASPEKERLLEARYQKVWRDYKVPAPKKRPVPR